MTKASAPERVSDRLRAAEKERAKRFANAIVDRDLLIEAADEIDRLEALYIQAVNGRRDFREALRQERRAAHQALEERFTELKRAQSIIDGLKAYRENLLTCRLDVEPAGRERILELATPIRDDYDRAVVMLVADMERLIKAIAMPLSKGHHTGYAA